MMSHRYIEQVVNTELGAGDEGFRRTVTQQGMSESSGSGRSVVRQSAAPPLMAALSGDSRRVLQAPPPGPAPGGDDPFAALVASSGASSPRLAQSAPGGAAEPSVPPATATGLFGKPIPPLMAQEAEQCERQLVTSREMQGQRRVVAETGEREMGNKAQRVGVRAQRPAGKTGTPGRTISSIRSRGLRGRPNITRRTSLDKREFGGDVGRNTVLLVRGMPQELNTRPVLFSHFSQYGSIARMYNYPSRGQATIHFESHSGAVAAKNRGSVLQEGDQTVQLTIFWKKQDSTRQPAVDVTRSARSPTASASSQRVDRSDVDDELSALKDSADDFTAETGIPRERPAELVQRPSRMVAMGTGLEQAPRASQRLFTQRPRPVLTGRSPQRRIVSGGPTRGSTRLTQQKPTMLFGKVVTTEASRGAPKQKLEELEEEDEGIDEEPVIHVISDDEDEGMGEAAATATQASKRGVVTQGLFQVQSKDNSKPSIKMESGPRVEKAAGSTTAQGGGAGTFSWHSSVAETKPAAQPLFGGSGHMVAAQKTDASTPSVGLFGKPVNASQGQATASSSTNTGLFGKLFQSAEVRPDASAFLHPAPKVFSTEPAGLFGTVSASGTTAVTSLPSSLSSSTATTGLFGTVGSSVFSQPNTVPAAGLFGKHLFSAETKSFSAPSTQSVAGTSRATGLFGKPTPSPSAPMGLFGMPVSDAGQAGSQAEVSQSEGSKASSGMPAIGLFGKPLSAEAKPAGIFSAATLFGKPASSAEGTTAPTSSGVPPLLFGKPVSSAEGTAASTSSSVPPILFGKPASSAEGTAVSTSSSVPQILFGKPASSAEGTAVSTSSSVPPLLFGKPASSAEAKPTSVQPAVLESSGMFGGVTVKVAGIPPATESAPPPVLGGVGLPGRPRTRSPSPGPSRSTSPRPRRTSIELDGKSLRELQALQRKIPQTIAEQIEILDARDKLLHKARKKEKGRSHGEKVTHGTCPDMCPEKERLLREEQRRLHPYEVLAGSEGNPRVDHTRAVKEYSRSSADQEFPLPHDLRPAPVLRLSMRYLLTHIADRGRDGGWGDWFDFLWSRTRGIRKDITQQRLCDQASVELLEQCSRFHIFCAERLCEEDPSVFDVKINNENLTKCLQSLKEMYHDLRVKQGMSCPDEPEFRAYMVLMNLNEGDILREVQQLDESIRASPQVTFVVNVYAALNSNNYVRFFKLVRRATFLNGCIMHRYFTQVRVQALRAIIRSHTNPGSRSTMPLSDLVRFLAFEDEQHVETFCGHHELTTEDGGLVLFKSNQLILPEAGLAACRAVNVVEGKLHTSVGEVINGRPLEDIILPTPTTSFDSQGRFKGLDVEVEEVEEGMLEVEEAEEEAAAGDAPEEPGRRAASKLSNEAVKQIAKELFIEVIQEMASGVSQGCVQMIQMVTRGSQLVIQDLVEEETGRAARAIVEETMDLARRAQAEQDARQRAEAARVRQLAADAVADAILDETVGEMAHSMAAQQYRAVQLQLCEESEARCSTAVAAVLVEQVMQQVVQGVAREVHERDVVQRLQQLEESARALRAARTARWWARWLQVLSRRQRLKRGMQTFPSAPSLLPSTQQLDRLLADGHGLLPGPQAPGVDSSPDQWLQGARLTLQGAPEVYAQQIHLYREMKLHAFLRRRKHERAWAPLDVCHILQRSLHTAAKPAKAAGAIYWKLLVSVEDLSQAEDTCATWLLHKFQKGKLPPKQSSKSVVLSLYTAEMLPTGQELGVCVRGLLGQPEPSMGEGGKLQGAGCLMLLVTSRELERLGSVRQRLAGLLSMLPPQPAVPVAVLVQGEIAGDQLAQVAAGLGLPELRRDRCLSHYVLYHIGMDVEQPFASTEVAAAVAWLAEHPADGVSVEGSSLRELLEATICREYSCRVYQDLAARRKMNAIHQDPNLLIDLYNSIIEFLATQILAVPDLCDLSWPVTEFAKQRSALPAADWNSPESLVALEAQVLALRLPAFAHARPESEEWEDARADVMGYLQALAGPTSSAHLQLFSRVRWLLEKAEEQFELDCFWVERVRGAQPCYVNMPWADVIEACIAFRLQEVPWEDEDGELQVHYLPSKLSCHQPPPSWLTAMLDLHDQDQSVLACVQRASTKRKKGRHASQASPGKQPKLSKTVTAGLDLQGEPAALREARQMTERLRNLIGKEKDASLRLNSYLDECINSTGKELCEDTIKHKGRCLFSDGLENQAEAVSARTKRRSTPTVDLSDFKEDIPPTSKVTMVTPVNEGAKRPKYVSVLAEKLLEQGLEEQMEELERRMAGARQDERLLQLRLETLLLQAQDSPD